MVLKALKVNQFGVVLKAQTAIHYVEPSIGSAIHSVESSDSDSSIGSTIGTANVREPN